MASLRPAGAAAAQTVSSAGGVSRGLPGSCSARDAASLRHVAHYFGLITLLLWAYVRRKQTAERDEAVHARRATHCTLARLCGGTTLAASPSDDGGGTSALSAEVTDQTLMSCLRRRLSPW